jgi:hypothetical protein
MSAIGQPSNTPAPSGQPATPPPSTGQAAPTPQEQGQQTQQRESGFWGRFPTVPEDQRAALEPHLKQVQGYVTRLEQTYVAPFKGYTPQQVQGLAQFAKAFDTNPLQTFLGIAAQLQQAGTIHEDLDLEALAARRPEYPGRRRSGRSVGKRAGMGARAPGAAAGAGAAATADCPYSGGSARERRPGPLGQEHPYQAHRGRLPGRRRVRQGHHRPLHRPQREGRGGPQRPLAAPHHAPAGCDPQPARRHCRSAPRRAAHRPLVTAAAREGL